jgi:putative FmdB family regulatory protein
MPTYEYKCDKCGYVFEEFQSMSDEHLTACPKCEGHVQRLIGPGAGLIFKGSGFYLTDYKKSSSSPATSTTNGGNGSSKKTEAAVTAPKGEKPSTTDKAK